MTELLEMAVERIRTLMPELQDEAGRLLFDMANKKEDVYVLRQEGGASFAQALDDVANGRFATDEEVEAIWAKDSA